MDFTNKNSNTIRKRRLSHLAIVSYNLDIISSGTDEKKVPDTEKISDENGDTFHKAIWPVLALANCFGIMPVDGVRNPKAEGLQFRWRSVKVALTIIYLISGLLMLLLFTKRVVDLGLNARSIVGVIFFFDGTFAGLLFLFLSQRWKSIMEEWSRLERPFLSLPYRIIGWRLSTKIRMTAAFFLLLALVEHVMFLTSISYSYVINSRMCNWNVADPWKDFFVTEYRHFFLIIPYHWTLTILVEWINIALTFVWNYMDIIVMLLSIGISTRFNQINYRLNQLKKVPESTWHEVRHHFVLLCELLEMVDTNLAPLILLSCTNNLYFICVQLLNVFKKLPYFINYMYFWYSLLYLIGRTCVVFMCAAAINDASKKPIESIRSVPTNEWCTETERFLEQVTTEQIALSGMKFFFMTRKLLLGMAGTVVTYELVLLQFDVDTKDVGTVNVCDRF